MTCDELLSYLLTHEQECKCRGNKWCYGCEITVLKDEIRRLNNEVAQLKEENRQLNNKLVLLKQKG